MSPSATSAPLLRLSPLLAVAVATLTAVPATAQTTAPPVTPSTAPSIAPSTAPSAAPSATPSITPSATASVTPSRPPAAGQTGTLALTYDSCSDLPSSQLLTLSISGGGVSDGGRVSSGETATTPLPPGLYEARVSGGSGETVRGGLTQVDVTAGETTSLRTSALCGPPVQPATDVSIAQQEGLAYATLRVAYDSCPAYPGRPLAVSLEGTTDEGDDVDLAGRTLRPGQALEFTVVGGDYTVTSDIEGVGLYGTAAVVLADDETVVLDTAFLCTEDDGARDVPVPTRIETGFAVGGTTPGTGGQSAAAAAAATGVAALTALAGAGGILLARRRATGLA